MQREVTIENRRGVHSRVALELARIVGQYDAAVHLIHDNQRTDCGSVLEVLSRGLSCGTGVLVRTDGAEASEAMAAVVELLSKRDDP